MNLHQRAVSLTLGATWAGVAGAAYLLFPFTEESLPALRGIYWCAGGVTLLCAIVLVCDWYAPRANAWVLAKFPRLITWVSNKSGPMATQHKKEDT